MGNTSIQERGHTSGNGILYSRVRRLYNELMQLHMETTFSGFSVHMNLKNSKLFDLIAEKFKIATEPYLESKKNKEMDWLFDRI